MYLVLSITLPDKIKQITEMHSVSNALIAAMLLFFLSDFIISVFSKYPSVDSLRYIIPVSLSVSALLFFVILIFRIEYARSVLILSFMTVISYIVFSSYIVNKYRRIKVAVVPCGESLRLTGIHGVSWRILKRPRLGKTRYDAIAADFNALTHEWEKFISDASLKGNSVVNYKKLLESLTGRVDVKHLSAGDDGNLSPSSTFSLLKRFMDIFVVIFLGPLVLGLVLIAAVIVKLESPGDAFFTQNRVGRGGKEFKIFKLRSMAINSEENGAQFATSDDMRITKFGKFIRRTRIDELPQFLNILKGDMSLIGPRPEQKVFVKQFEKNIPFYGYRHIVRPGITGWAQVSHGYAASEDETRLKLEHDLYYIKNFSLWLDILIVFKTLHTMLTGFGAR